MKKQTAKKSEITSMIYSSLVDLPTPTSINMLWNMGFLLGMVMSSQIATGIFLSMFSVNNATDSFESIIMMSRNVSMGWMVRFFHMNGASLMFMLIYAHIARNMMFSSSSTKKHTWMSGITLLVLLMATAFLGYVLPWGQMSFWGATVITNLVSVIPAVGKTMVEWLWGNFSVSQPTLTRFFSLHVITPMAMLMMVMVHLMMLHSTGSSNPTGTKENMDKMKFSASMSNKDAQVAMILFTAILLISTATPLLMGDVENFNQANPLATPTHIQPEWYFLFAYAILRSIPSKMGGVVALAASILILAPMSFMKKKTKKLKPHMKTKEWTTATTFMILTWIGMSPVEPPFIKTGQLASTVYFAVMVS